MSSRFNRQPVEQRCEAATRSRPASASASTHGKNESRQHARHRTARDGSVYSSLRNSPRHPERRAASPSSSAAARAASSASCRAAAWR